MQSIAMTGGVKLPEVRLKPWRHHQSTRQSTGSWRPNLDSTRTKSLTTAYSSCHQTGDDVTKFGACPADWPSELKILRFFPICFQLLDIWSFPFWHFCDFSDCCVSYDRNPFVIHLVLGRAENYTFLAEISTVQKHTIQLAILILTWPLEEMNKLPRRPSFSDRIDCCHGFKVK